MFRSRVVNGNFAHTRHGFEVVLLLREGEKRPGIFKCGVIVILNKCLAVAYDTPKKELEEK